MPWYALLVSFHLMWQSNCCLYIMIWGSLSYSSNCMQACIDDTFWPFNHIITWNAFISIIFVNFRGFHTSSCGSIIYTCEQFKCIGTCRALYLIGRSAFDFRYLWYDIWNVWRIIPCASMWLRSHVWTVRLKKDSIKWKLWHCLYQLLCILESHDTSDRKSTRLNSSHAR